MNLQICAPYEPCVYNCPFCVARTHPQHNHQFSNEWAERPDYYRAKLAAVFSDYKIDCVVITGECDPTQNLAWAYDVIKVVRQFSDVPIEFQTLVHFLLKGREYQHGTYRAHHKVGKLLAALFGKYTLFV